MEIENELISNVENPAKAKASKEDVHIIQYRRLQLDIRREISSMIVVRDYSRYL